MKKVIVIAEAGVNHNGNLKIAKKLINVAKKARADYVKFQIYKTENLISLNTKTAEYQKRNLGNKISQYEMLKKYELSKENVKKLIKHSKKKKIKFLCSVFDIQSYQNLNEMNIFDVKIPSGEINNIPLLKKISLKAKKVFLSTGMATINEIAEAIKIFKKKINKNLYVLHCHSDYPTKYKDVNLSVMSFLKKKFKINVGYSDHTLGNIVSISAASLGAKVIEKHFTLSKKMKGPDHKASLEPQELIGFIKEIRKVETILGNKIKKISVAEKKNKKLVRKSIVAQKLIKKGEKFTNLNIECKRPEGGLNPKYFNKVLGKKAKKEFLKDQKIYI